MRLLEGKVALVTGGTSGIGRASAVLFAQEGAKVALTGRQSAEGEAVVAEIKAAGGDAIFIRADLAETVSIPGIIDRAVAAYGRLDCAFNNAGVSGGGPIETLDEAVWDRVIDTNLKAAFFCLQAEVTQMKQQGGGAILFNGSVLANIAFPGSSIYSASKGGISSLMRAAAVELGPHGIRVNSVNPSITRTPLTTTRIKAGADGTETHPYAPSGPSRCAGWRSRRRWPRSLCSCFQTGPLTSPVKRSSWMADKARPDWGQAAQGLLGKMDPGFGREAYAGRGINLPSSSCPGPARGRR